MTEEKLVVYLPKAVLDALKRMNTVTTMVTTEPYDPDLWIRIELSNPAALEPNNPKSI